MAAPPYMKLYVADFLADTLHLTRAQVGSYELLLMAMWRAGGKLPANDAKLAQIARCTPKEWAADRETLLALFQRKGGQITHKRLGAEIAKAGHVSGVRKAASDKGVSEKRKKISGEAQPIGEPNADQLGPYIRSHSDNPPTPLEGGGRTPAFEDAWSEWHVGAPANRGKAEAWAAWLVAAPETNGEAQLLRAVRTHLARLAGVPRQTRKAFHRWLRDRGYEAYPDDLGPPPVAWSGPADVWAVVVGARNEAFARTWLADCRWLDVPRAISGGSTCIRKLRDELGAVLAAEGIELQERAA